jgi:soluble lytic murein transglycosylase-like protein
MNTEAVTVDDNEEAPPPRRRYVVFHGKGVWLSELASMALGCALLAVLLSVSLIILKNEITIHEQGSRIAALKAERIVTGREMGVMREMERTVRLLDAAAGGSIPPEALYRLAEIIRQNSAKYGYSPEMLLAVIAVESWFNPEAMGRYRGGGLSGAIGIMQVKYETAAYMAKTLGMGQITREDLLNPEINMVLGTAYLVKLINQFNSFKLGILAYNLGPARVRTALAKNEALPMRYYEKVLRQYYRIKEMGEG